MDPRYDHRTGLLVVDVQNDFADPAGSLYVRGGDDIVPVIDDEIAMAEAAGATIVYTQDWHPPSTPHFEKDGGIWAVHCVQGTWGAEFHPALRIAGEVVRKGADGEDGYSGFSMRDPGGGAAAPTRLADVLETRGVSRLVVCGLATDYCVLETVLDARRLGYPTGVADRAIRAVDRAEGDGDRAIGRMRDAGAEVA